MPPLRRYRPQPVRETVTYPQILVTPENVACRNKSFPHEHVLACGHLITTPTPNEPCAPNCHHMAASKHQRNDKRMLPGLLNFYCDACVETLNETAIPQHISSTSAEHMRADLRRKEASIRGKDTKFRLCYIAQKTTSVPCDEEGDPVEEYAPCDVGHLFDTALPRTGANMFEHVDVSRRQPAKPERKTMSKKSSPAILVSDASESDDDAAPEDLNHTLVEGARWLREQEKLDRRRQEEGAPSVRKRRKLSKHSSKRVCTVP